MGISVSTIYPTLLRGFERSFAASQLDWDPKFLSQIDKKLVLNELSADAVSNAIDK